MSSSTLRWWANTKIFFPRPRNLDRPLPPALDPAAAFFFAPGWALFARGAYVLVLRAGSARYAARWSGLKILLHAAFPSSSSSESSTASASSIWITSASSGGGARARWLPCGWLRALAVLPSAPLTLDRCDGFTSPLLVFAFFDRAEAFFCALRFLRRLSRQKMSSSVSSVSSESSSSESTSSLSSSDAPPCALSPSTYKSLSAPEAFFGGS